MDFFKTKKRYKKKNENAIGHPVNLEAILQIYPLSKSTQDKLLSNGFLVLAEKEYDYLSECYFNLFLKEDVSVFITTDAMLHIFHVLYDGLLKKAELEYLCGLTEQLLIELQDKSKKVFDSIYDNQLYIKESSRRNVEFFTVALYLLKGDIDIPSYVLENVNNLVQKILEHSNIEMYPGEDFTQYKPRGHYEGLEKLEKYFRCMTWLSRQIFIIEDENHPELARYHLTQGVIISQLFKENSNIKQLWEAIYKITSTLVGAADSITIPMVQNAITNVFGESFTLDKLENFNNIIALRNEFSKSKYPESKISHVPQSYPGQMSNKYIQFMGGRYTLDGDVFQHTTFPTVPGRLLPKSLDMAATVLDSGRARVHLAGEIKKYPQLKTQIKALQSKFSDIPVKIWRESIYNNWLYILKTLTPLYGAPYPHFMRNTAWYDEKLNTVLASWTQLRHDNILYSQQSMVPAPYAIGHGYVEPIPEFYTRLAALSEKIRAVLSEFDLLSIVYGSSLLTFEGWLTRFKVYADKELNNQPLTLDEQNHIKRFGLELLSFFSGQSGGDGPKEQKPILVADVCTDSNTGRVLHEGVGKFNPMIVIYDEPLGTTRAGIGFVMSYFEFVEPNFNRMTDTEWEAMVESGRIPDRPGWTGNFLIQT